MCEEQIFDFNLSQLSILHYILCIVSNYLIVCTGFDKISGEERPVCLCNEGYRGKKQGQQDIYTGGCEGDSSRGQRVRSSKEMIQRRKRESQADHCKL